MHTYRYGADVGTQIGMDWGCCGLGCGALAFAVWSFFVACWIAFVRILSRWVGVKRFRTLALTCLRGREGVWHGGWVENPGYNSDT